MCAVYRADSPVAPLSITRRCEKCCCLVMTSPSSQPLIDAGARICCATCAEAEAPVNHTYEMLPGQLDELTRLGGPIFAVAAEAAIELANRHARRGRN